jgi:hypothetical protein
MSATELVGTPLGEAGASDFGVAQAVPKEAIAPSRSWRLVGKIVGITVRNTAPAYLMPAIDKSREILVNPST